MDHPNHKERGHSPLGASGAERWMNCPGSVALLRELKLPESDEPDYRREGTAMHEAAEHCLRTGCDTWEIVGQTFNNTVIDQPMAEAIQVYLDDCRKFIDRAAYHYVELSISSPGTHPDFYGSMDFGAVIGAPATPEQQKALSWARPYVLPTEVVVKDLKGGEGIVVDPEENPQLKYYAFGLIDQNPHWPDDVIVRIGITQPRAFHHAGPVREWTTTVGEIRAWVRDVLVPAMDATQYDHNLDAGPWCRFCAAKLVCPLLTSLFRAACTANPQELIDYSDESIARSWQYSRAVKFYLNALEAETFRRLNAGHVFDGIAKLVPKRANRVFKPEGIPIAKAKFGDEAFTKPELKSPAEIEKIGPAAKEFVKEYAYMPSTGLTVAPWDDPKPGVKVESSDEAFGSAVAALGFLEEEK